MENPVDLFARVAGQGFPILCLHGHPGSSRTMSVFTEPLSRHYRTISPDLRGYGRSQTTKPFTMDDHLADLEALLNRQSIECCLILGWSLGGILAIELALRHPDRVAGLILVATSAYPRSQHPPITWKDEALTAIASLINWVWPGAQWNIDLFGRRSLYRYLIQQHTPHAYQRLATEGLLAYLQTSRLANNALKQALRQRYNQLAKLPRIQCPVLLLAAESDVHITAESSLETAQYLSHCQVHLYPKAAHLFPWEIPHQVCADIARWLHQEGLITQ